MNNIEKIINDEVEQRLLAALAIVRRRWLSRSRGRHERGMGADAFVSNARGQGCILTVERAKELKAAWLIKWPETQRYFQYINQLCEAGGGRTPVPIATRQLRAAKPAAKPAKQANVKASRRGGRLARRTPEEIEASATAIIAFVRDNPGARSEQIRAALGIEKREWLQPIAVAIAKGLGKRGEKRATEYFCGKVPEGGAKAPKAKKSSKKGKRAKKSGKKIDQHVNGAAPEAVAASLTPEDQPFDDVEAPEAVASEGAQA